MAEWERQIPASWYASGEAEPFLQLVGNDPTLQNDYMLQMYFHQAFYDSETDQRTREYMRDQMSEYMEDEYGIDFYDLFDDWEDYRAWYDSL